MRPLLSRRTSLRLDLMQIGDALKMVSDGNPLWPEMCKLLDKPIYIYLLSYESLTLENADGSKFKQIKGKYSLKPSVFYI